MVSSHPEGCGIPIRKVDHPRVRRLALRATVKRFHLNSDRSFRNGRVGCIPPFTTVETVHPHPSYSFRLYQTLIKQGEFDVLGFGWVKILS